LRFHLATDRQACEVGLAAAAAGEIGWAEVLHSGRHGVVLLPFGNVDDDYQIALERHLAEHPDWLGEVLGRFLLPNGTLVVLDTPPGPSVYLQQALRIANVTVVTVLPDAGSFATLPLVERMVDKYCRGRDDFIANLCVVNQVDASHRLNRDVLAALRAEWADDLLGVVHEDQAVCEALASASDVRGYEPLSQAADDFTRCTQRLLERLAPTREGTP
jgi:cellulose synthase operon protein YhjQ